jgi:hypothetical protein
MPRAFGDAQQALSFMVQQASYIEAEVYRIQYPDIVYPTLIPIDESAPDWTKSVTFFSMDKLGKAEWFHHMATDMPLADITRAKFEVGIEMAGIGYRYTLEELGQAMMQNIALTTERAAAATRAYEEFMERVAITGDVTKTWTGLINDGGVLVVTAPVGGGAGATTDWATKTGDEIAADINSVITGMYLASQTIELADTILLPPEQFQLIAVKRMGTGNDTTSVLDWISKYNVFTAQTGRPLLIRMLRQLTGAGTAPAGSDRMVAYRRDPSVVKMHVPMRHRFLPVWQTGPITFDIPGIFRTGGVEIRRPGAFRYMDGIGLP